MFAVSWVIQEASARLNAPHPEEALCPCPSGSKKRSGGVHFLVAACGITVFLKAGSRGARKVEKGEYDML